MTDSSAHCDDGRSLANTYYVEVRDSEYKSTGAGSVPMLRDGVVSEPACRPTAASTASLLDSHSRRAVVYITTSRTPDHSIMQAAQSPWRVVALPWNEKTRTGQVKDSGVVFIGLSLSDQIDTANTLTRFCAMVGIAVVLIGAILGTILVQSTLAPLKRIEKTAAKIAAEISANVCQTCRKAQRSALVHVAEHHADTHRELPRAGRDH